MVSGMLALLIASTAMGTGPAKAPERYRVDLKSEQLIDLSSAGMANQSAGLTASIFLNVTTRDTTGGSIAHVVIDSVTLTAEGQMASVYTDEAATAARGQSIDAHIVGGKIEGDPTFSVPDSPMLTLAVQGLNAMFVGISADRVQQKSWVDTVTKNTENPAVTINSTSITSWSVTGTSGDVLSLSGTAEGTITGEQGGNPVTGTVKGTVVAESPIGGPSRSATYTSNQKMNILVAQFPDPITVVGTSSVTLVRLP